MLLAHLLTTNNEWRSHEIRVLRVVEKDAAREEVTRHLKEVLADARINAQVDVLVSDDPRTTLQSHSRLAAMVFMGMTPPEEGAEEAFFRETLRWAGDARTLVLVNSAGRVSLET